MSRKKDFTRLEIHAIILRRISVITLSKKHDFLKIRSKNYIYIVTLPCEICCFRQSLCIMTALSQRKLLL